MQKIVLLTDDQSGKGGTEHATAALANTLQALGHDVEIASIYLPRSNFFPVHPAVKLTSITNRKEFGLKKLIILNIYIAMKYMNEKNTIIICVDSIIFLYVILLKILAFKIRLITWEHFNALVNLGLKSRSIARIIACRLADQIIVLTEQDRNFWIKNLKVKPHKIKCIPNSIIQNRSNHQETDNGKVVVAVGRLEPQKNFSELIDIWEKIKKDTKKDWTLRIVGEGSEKNLLEKKIKKLGLQEEIKLVGHLEQQNEIYKKASIFAFTSVYEGFGLVLLEAMKYGLAIVSYDCPCGPSEILGKEGKFGILVEQGNVINFSQQLELLMNDDYLRRKLRENGKNRIKKYSPQSIGEMWNKIFCDLK